MARRTGFRLHPVRSKKNRSNGMKRTDFDKAMQYSSRWVKESTRKLNIQLVRLHRVAAFLAFELWNLVLSTFTGSTAGKQKSKKQPSVDLCLILGGHFDREKEALRDANSNYPQTPIWMTGPALSEECLIVCRSVGCDTRFIRVDYNALDTLSNFTTLVDDIEDCRFEHVAIFTSRHHMTRAMLMAGLILPAYGIKAITPVIVKQSGSALYDDGAEATPTGGTDTDNKDGDEESIVRTIRDVVRSLLWLLVGTDPAQYIIRFLHPERALHKDRRVDNLSFTGGLANSKHPD